MSRRLTGRLKNGAASFYIVAFSTSILVILAVSFASVIISEVTRTSNDDLSQSAYDSALAGVEDAKLAYANYQRCAESGVGAPAGVDLMNNNITCEDIMYWMAHPDCDMVAHILGRIGKNESSEVLVSESSSGSDGNNLKQAYTCVLIKTTLSDYRASLSSSNPTKIIKVELDSVSAASIGGIRISWYSNPGGEKYNYNNFDSSTKKVAFRQISTFRAATPPTIAVQLVQTAEKFKMEDLFKETQGNETDRATVYLVPAGDKTSAGKNIANNYNGAWNISSNKNIVGSSQVASTNNLQKNLPYVVYCDPSSTNEFACTAEIELPEPIGGERSNDTFMLAVNMPYGQPDADFSVEFLCKSGVADCETRTAENGTSFSAANVKDVQVMIDSTGRANDLYRRIEARLEASDTSFPYQFYALEGLNKETSSYAIKKELTVTCENNFYNGWSSNC